jgi:hypothetical protein
MKKMTIKAGARRKKPPASRNGSGDASSEPRSCAGSVRSLRVRIAAAKTSFHEVTKTKIADAATPGRASGSATRRNADRRLQPRVIAASSSS